MGEIPDWDDVSKSETIDFSVQVFYFAFSRSSKSSIYVEFFGNVWCLRGQKKWVEVGYDEHWRLLVLWGVLYNNPINL
jgi:hypothetical protein